MLTHFFWFNTSYNCSKLIIVTYRLQTPPWTAPGHSYCPQGLWECSLTAWHDAAECAALTPSQSLICLWLNTQLCRHLPSSCTVPSATGCYPSGMKKIQNLASGWYDYVIFMNENESTKMYVRIIQNSPVPRCHIAEWTPLLHPPQ